MKKLFINIAVILCLAGTAYAQNIDINIMPKPGPTPEVKVEKPKTFKLNNGLTVLVVENHKLPRVGVTLTMDRPPLYEGDKAGYNSLLGDLLGTGTNKMSKDDFNKRIDFLGARVSFNAGGASMNSLSKYFPEVLELMADGALNPKFTQEELSKAKDRYVESLKTREKSTDAIASRVFRALTYGKNTARGEFETAQSIRNVNLSDIQAAYKKYYIPDNAYLVIVGDVKFEEAKKLVEQKFGGWKKAGTLFKPLEQIPAVAKTQIDVVHVPNAVQTVLIVGNVHNLKMNNGQYFPAVASNYILGGGAESRLFMNLRERNSFTYGAYSSLNTGKYSQDFTSEASVRTDATDKAVKEIINEINAIKKITPAELDNAKAKLKGSFIMALEKPETIARYALSTYTQNLPADFYNNYLKSVDKMTVAEVQNAAQTYIQPNKLRIFVAGNAIDFADKLEALGYPVKYYDAYANPVAKPELKKADAGVTVAGIAQKYIEAIGGKAALDKVKSISMDASTTVQGMPLDLSTKSAPGGKMLLVMKMMGNVMQKLVFDGKEGYMEAQGQKMPLPDKMKNEFQENADLFPEVSFASNPKYTLGAVETVNGEEAYIIKYPGKTLYYSIKTGLKIGEIKTQSVQGKETTIPTYYADYRDVEGVKMPFTIKQNMSGMDVDFKVKSYEFNKAADADFK